MLFLLIWVCIPENHEIAPVFEYWGMINYAAFAGKYRQVDLPVGENYSVHLCSSYP